MTRKRRTIAEARAVQMQLVDILRDLFDNNGPLVLHDPLADEHVSRNRSRSAADDVALYGGPAVVYLRNEENYAIVPVTAGFDDFDGDPQDEVVIANAVAGLGAGGPRVGWYHPSGKDDWLWVYYVGHLGRSGIHAIFHATRQMDQSPHLLSAKGRRLLAERTIAGLPVPPGKAETAVLTARIGD